MVSFNCDACGDVVKKPKLLQHFNRCYAPVTCLDCSMQFNSPNEFKSHNSCISEAEKYQKTIYKGPKTLQQPQQQNGTPQKDLHHRQEQQKPNPAPEASREAEVISSPSPSKQDKKKEKRKRQELEDEAKAGPVAADQRAPIAPQASSNGDESKVQTNGDDEQGDERKAKKAKKAAEKAAKKEKKDQSKKHKAENKTDQSAATDSRFDLSQFDAVDAGSTSQAAATAAAATGPSESDQDEAIEDSDKDEAGDEEHEQDDPMDEAKVLKPLNAAELEAFKKKQRKLGIIYISRIPPGMTPAKVRHILSNFGEVGRMYLKDGNEKPGEFRKSKKRRSAFYTEGWVEFLSKKVAKATAAMLNAQPIGALAASKSKNGGLLAGGVKAGKNARRFQDEVWTMKYLKGFKWHMLSEQMAQERAALTAQMRTEMSQSAYEQNDYLRKVERAKMQKFKEDKKRKRAEEKGETVSGARAEGGAEEGQKGFKTFKQKKPVVLDVREQRAAQEAS